MDKFVYRARMRRQERAKIQKRKKFIRACIFLCSFLFVCGVVYGYKILSSNIYKSNNYLQSPENTTFQESTKSVVKLSIVGDITCNDTLIKEAFNSETNLYDFSNVFKNVKEYLNTSDITIGDLETNFTGDAFRIYW